MDLSDTPQQAEFRAGVRAWIDQHKDESPPPLRAVHVADPAPYRAWQHKLALAGLVGVSWPREHGGGGLGVIEEVIAAQEMARAGCSTIADLVIGDVGPAIYTHGSEEQKSRFLPPMLHGDEGWCQLFSEPAAGSDLAGLRTRAAATDSGWRIDGQKVWTSMAQHADYGLLIARTDSEVPKHKGLTMFIVDMHAPGVTVRPLRLMSGAAPFSEVFFDGVEVEQDAVVGGVGAGWAVAITTLMYERLQALSMFEHLIPTPEELLAGVCHHEALGDGAVRRQIAEVTVERLSLRFAGYRALDQIQDGRVPGAESGLGKIGLVEAGRKSAELIGRILGPDALESEYGELAAEMPGLRSAAGTEEILRTTIGERVLGLPPEPRADKDTPFSELIGGLARRSAPVPS